MKPNFLKAFFIMFSLSFMSTTCEDDDAPIDNSSEIAEIIATAQTDTWRITNYVDSGENETSDYAGYDFTFEANGTLTATNGTITKTGTWSVTDDSSSSSSNDDDIDFNIFFQVPDTDDFEDLNDDWDIVSYTSNQIVLRDVSGGDGSIDDLTFTRNQ